MPPATGEQSHQELRDGRFKVFPASSAVKEGTCYRFEVYTHCGVEDSAVDFDGSMWDYTGSTLTTGPEGQLDDPSDTGTIMLVDEDTAEYTSARGAVLELTRLRGPKVVPACM